MTNFARKMFLRLIAETSGAEIAEAAAVLPLMFMILLGIFWFGQAFSIYGAINRAAHEGARNVQNVAKSTQDVASNITAVNRGATETGSASTEVLNSAKTLSVESSRLRQELDQFMATIRAA